MSPRRQHVPWKAAGSASESEQSADDVVRETGWVFNNRTGDDLNLAEFVRTGNHETMAYLQAFGLAAPNLADQTLVEIGSGIGRMTASFTKHFGRVIACDLDAAFLERCRQTVAQFGEVSRLQTCHVADGRTLQVPDGTADITFSYITFQHCHHDDAIGLTREAIRVTKPGGYIALNYRTWVLVDALLWPAGKAVRASWRLPTFGPRLAQRRLPARLGWQANRLAPKELVPLVAPLLDDVRIVRSDRRRPFQIAGAADGVYQGMHRSHWWLVARVR